MKDNSFKCPICSTGNFNYKFSKKSDLNESFDLFQCKKCKLQMIFPVPDEKVLQKYYTKNYFTKRTSRGYNNYFSDEVRNEIERVIELNLRDLNFEKFEKEISNKRSFDVGCAAGYFVNYLKKRGWESSGTDVSDECIKFGKNELNLDLYDQDYIKLKFNSKFQLITLWATIEHLSNPGKILKKIHSDLDNNGRFYLSTCRAQGLNFMKFFGKNWRYYNFPEHIFFFSIKNLKILLKNNGFKVEKVFTYGSGMGKQGSLARKISDFLARYFKMGDMMVISATKEGK